MTKAADLRGRRFGVGSTGGGGRQAAREILENAIRTLKVVGDIDAAAKVTARDTVDLRFLE